MITASAVFFMTTITYVVEYDSVHRVVPFQRLMGLTLSDRTNKQGHKAGHSPSATF